MDVLSSIHHTNSSIHRFVVNSSQLTWSTIIRGVFNATSGVKYKKVKIITPGGCYFKACILNEREVHSYVVIFLSMGNSDCFTWSFLQALPTPRTFLDCQIGLGTNLYSSYPQDCWIMVIVISSSEWELSSTNYKR